MVKHLSRSNITLIEYSYSRTDSVSISPDGSRTASYVAVRKRDGKLRRLSGRQPDGKLRRLSVRQPEGKLSSYVGYSSGTNIYLLNYIKKM